ncbi:thiamine phosphate synthase [Campylobacter volucris]|uniref:Thiamine-phosphate synthase n=1 Tax=Campylobacter volucris TaxID=1031542 RepID=A0AAE5YG74_9BACT|nr:thiamine phosphate synthase [Campylobacter volucris LMG 24379]KAB0580544.1 thiamine phosphate synthase [Campylobacter volucris]QBL13244.1 thiamine phosphate synthase [Campylobacter volucris]QEL08614.1 thiamine phosphate synthase (TMP-TENI domain) [Campylobacter volucris]TXK70280.1 thiamine phosphate synthase [Campylobacter volucris]
MNSYKIYLVASKEQKSEDKFLNIVKEALKAGVNIVQLREKELNTLEFYNLALKVKRLCDEFKVPFLINDRIDIALAVDASGVHIGQKDLPLKIARQILGDEKLIGLTINHKSELVNLQKADYIGVGAVFPTPSKKECMVLGIDGLKEIVNLSPLSVVAIGGIDHANISLLKGIAIDGVAVIRAIMDAKDPSKSVFNLKQAFESL